MAKNDVYYDGKDHTDQLLSRLAKAVETSTHFENKGWFIASQNWQNEAEGLRDRIRAQINALKSVIARWNPLSQPARNVSVYIAEVESNLK